jgi:hypothetical protein
LANHVGNLSRSSHNLSGVLTNLSRRVKSETPWVTTVYRWVTIKVIA